MKLRNTDTVLLWPDGHHEFRVVPHTDKYPPPTVVMPLPRAVDPRWWETGEMDEAGFDVALQYFHRVGKITSKLTFSGWGFQRKQRLWVYTPLPYPNTITQGALADIAEEFFATKRKQHA